MDGRLLSSALAIYLIVVTVLSFGWGYWLVRQVIKREDQILKGVEALIKTLNLQREDQAAMLLLAEIMRGSKEEIEFRRET